MESLFQNYGLADLHLFDTSALARRPQFKTIEEMNDNLLQPIYALPRYANLFIIGDTCKGKVSQVEDLLSKASCKLHLVWGNHDRFSLRQSSIWTTSQPYLEVWDRSYGKNLIVMFHYPILDWNKMHYGAKHFHGHLHSSFLSHNRADLGVDSKHWGGKPVAFKTVLEEMEKLEK